MYNSFYQNFFIDLDESLLFLSTCREEDRLILVLTIRIMNLS